jgi:hypothetical protein
MRMHPLQKIKQIQICNAIFIRDNDDLWTIRDDIGHPGNVH